MSCAHKAKPPDNRTSDDFTPQDLETDPCTIVRSRVAEARAEAAEADTVEETVEATESVALEGLEAEESGEQEEME